MPQPLDDGFTQDYPTPALDLMDAMNEIEDLHTKCDALNHEAQNLLCIIERLKDDNKRLRVALEDIANVYCPNGNLARDIAKALGEE